MKLKICLPGYCAPPSGIESQLIRTKLEHTDISIFRVGATQQTSHIHLSVQLLSAKHAASTNSSRSIIPVVEILQEVWQQCWEGGIMGMGQLPVPVKIRLNNIEYTEGNICYENAININPLFYMHKKMIISM